MAENDLAEDVLKAQARLAGERGEWESHWQEVADRCAPRLADFTVLRSPGERRNRLIHDSTAMLAVENFAAAIMGMIVPRESMWHGLRSGIAELDRRPAVQLYFEQVRDLLFYHRYAPHANFANQFYECVISQGLFGTSGLWVDQEMGARRGLVYRNVHLAELYIEENHHGRVDTVYRRSRLPAAQWEQRWGKEGRLPPQVREALASGQRHKMFEFVHCIRPRANYDPERLDARALPIQSVVVACQDRMVVSDRGFRSMPLLVGRYSTSSREVYGRGPAMQALPDIHMTNEMVKTLLRAAHRAVAPPLLTSDDGVLSRLAVKPNAVNVGGLDFQGRPLVRPLETGGSIPVGMEMVEASRSTIEKAFLVPLFSILTDTPDRMTATEVLQRAQEKGILLSPVAGKLEGELLGPMIEREIDILASMGALPPMPPELIEAEGEYRVTYDNPLQRAAQSERTIGMLRWIEMTAPVAAQKPEIWDLPKWEDWGRTMAVDNAVPVSLMRTADELEAIKEGQQMQVEAQAALQGAELAGNAALKLAQAQEVAASAGA